MASGVADGMMLCPFEEALLDLGVTTVELLPVHESVPEAFLLQRGLTNYRGYNTIGYFAPHQAYSAAVRAGRPGRQVTEFKAMVDALHRAGLEVLLDVVFNHSAEGNQLGPTLCFEGLDNPAYYRLDPADPRDYIDTTGCGNSHGRPLGPAPELASRTHQEGGVALARTSGADKSGEQGLQLQLGFR